MGTEHLWEPPRSCCAQTGMTTLRFLTSGWELALHSRERAWDWDHQIHLPAPGWPQAGWGRWGRGWVPLMLALASPKSWAGGAGSAGQGCLRDHRTSTTKPGEQVSALLPIPPTEPNQSSWSPLSLVKQLELHDPREKWNWDMDVLWGSGLTWTCTVILMGTGAKQSHNILLSELE